jgi:arsenate reductase
MSRERQRVLFLCVGNSCRSQMAEAIVNARCAARWRAYSAGTRPSGAVHPMALRVLAESGIRHKGKSKGVASFRGLEFDLVVTVCDSMQEECPIWHGSGIRVHHEYPDPSTVAGSEEEQLTAFRKIRDLMLAELPYLLQKHENGRMDQ